MFRVNPICKEFVPHTKRLVLPNNEDFFVDGANTARGAAGVKLQDYACQDLPFNAACPRDFPYGRCDINGDCIVGLL
jgi:hypothetical protein